MERNGGAEMRAFQEHDFFLLHQVGRNRPRTREGLWELKDSR